MKIPFDDIITHEITITSSKSSGPGGQHVNKTNSKAHLSFAINESQFLPEEQKKIIHNTLKNKINKSGILQLSNQTERSYCHNIRQLLDNFKKILTQALKTKKERKVTTKPKSADEQRLKAKKQQSLKKECRNHKAHYE